jgi:hypothetical protein
MKIQTKPIIWFLTLLALLTTSHLASAYYDPGVQRWINRDPLGEPGFEVMRGPNNRPAAAVRPRVAPSGRNLYGLVRNHPLSHYDPFGLAERGPGTIACQQATEQAEAAWDVADAEPWNTELEDLAILASFNAAYWCTPPVQPPPKKCPWWRNIPPIWRWPLIIPWWWGPGGFDKPVEA